MPLFLAELLYSAVLWGSLITLLLWWLLRKLKGRVIWWYLWLPFGWFALHTVIAWYGFLIPPSGRLIDADSGEPIENTRVVAAWLGYPLSLWSSSCSGQQAHLTDVGGDFAFRFAPYPTLLSGSMLRGLQIRVPGRITADKVGWFFTPLRGGIPVRRFKPGERMIGETAGISCEQPTSQFSYKLLPLEAHPIDVMYREACIEQQPSTLTDAYLREMMRLRSIKRDSLWNWPPPDSPPTSIQQLDRERLRMEGRCTQGYGVCASAIEPALRDQFCAYFATLLDAQGGMP